LFRFYFSEFSCLNARSDYLPVKNRIGQMLCFAAVFQLLGGHWAILQTAAWVGMIIEYSANDGLQAGLAKTFDGEHPCELCKSIANHKGAEKKHAAQLEFGKINVVSEVQVSVLHPPEQFWRWRLSKQSIFSVPRTPPVPPPRGLIG
jgi:hypothetical protein